MTTTENKIERFLFNYPDNGQPGILILDMSEPQSQGYYDTLMLTSSIEETDRLCVDIVQKQKKINVICTDPVNFNNAVSAHESVARSLNEKIQEYEKVFDRQITLEDFNHIKNYNVTSLQASFKQVIEERLADISSKTLKEIESKALENDARDFFQSFALGTLLVGSRAKYVSLHRIRLLNGKATFNDHDARALLEEQYSVDIARSEYAVLIEKFESLRSSYNELCDHLVECRDVIKINPKNEALIRDQGFIYIDFATKDLKLDLKQLGNRRWAG